MKKVIVFSFVVLMLIIFCFFACTAVLGNQNNNNSSTVVDVQNVSDKVLSYRSTVEKYCNEFNISNYVNYILAIMMVESGGYGNDVMQCSESLGLAPNAISSADKSIKQGCKVFSEHLQNVTNADCDIDTAVQAYNYGGSFIDYVASNGKKYSFELACSFAEDKSNGEKVKYRNDISNSNGGWKYVYGNMFYVLLVKQYLVYSSVSSSNLAEYALQFVGENHSRFTSYKSKNGNGFGDDWCAMFVSYCLDNCGYIDSGKAFWYVGCTTAYNQMLADGTFKHSKYWGGSYIPQSGDLIFFTDNGSSSYHTGIVTSVEGNTVHTVEGNTGESRSSPYWMGSNVCKCSYDIDTYKILGYYPIN